MRFFNANAEKTLCKESVTVEELENVSSKHMELSNVIHEAGKLCIEEEQRFNNAITLPFVDTLSLMKGHSLSKSFQIASFALMSPSCWVSSYQERSCTRTNAVTVLTLVEFRL